MKTLKKVLITPVFVDLIPEVLEENHLYISIPYSTSSHNCLCGCGFLTVLPFDKNFGWEIEITPKSEGDDMITLTPSILNRPCSSHYIIRKNVANFV